MLVTVAYSGTVPPTRILRDLGTLHVVKETAVSPTDLTTAVTDILVQHPHVVFNLVENPAFAALLKDFRVPYTGSDAHTLILAENTARLQRAISRVTTFNEQATGARLQILLVGYPKPRIAGVAEGEWVPDRLRTIAEQQATELYTLLGMSGYGRFDYIVDDYRAPQLSKIAMNTSIHLDDALFEAVCAKGTTYAQLLDQIVKAAVSRHADVW